MKKAVLIGGGVLLVGGLAYLYFANKKKTEKLLSGSATPSTSGGATTSTTPSGTSSTIDSEIPPLSTGGIVTSTTKGATIQEQENLDKANDIVAKIKNLEKLSIAREAYISRWKPSSFQPSWTKPTNTYPIAIKKLKDDLLKLGYEYKGTTDGTLVKL